MVNRESRRHYKWLPISNTSYSALFVNPANATDFFAFYLNRNFDQQLMFLYPLTTMQRFSKIVVGSSAFYQPLDLSKKVYEVPANKVYAPQPEILPRHKFGTAIYVCNKN